MLALAFGSALFVLGCVLVGTAWAWFDTRRRQRELGARQDRIGARQREIDARFADAAGWTAHVNAELRRLEDARYDHAKDLDALAQGVPGFVRYTRGGGVGE